MALQVDGGWGLVKPHYRVGIDQGFSNWGFDALQPLYWGMACSPAFFFQISQNHYENIRKLAWQ